MIKRIKNKLIRDGMLSLVITVVKIVFKKTKYKFSGGVVQRNQYNTTRRKHIYEDIWINKSVVFKGRSDFSDEASPYLDWRAKRLSFLEKKMPIQENMTCLELGAGFGDISFYLASKNAIVTCCEGNKNNFTILESKMSETSNISCKLLDNDKDWSKEFAANSFDLVIHWGLLYHLQNWERDLRLSCRVGKAICLEIEVLDSSDPYLSNWRRETGNDQALNGIGVVPSWASIERIFVEEGMLFERFDSAEINSGIYTYDWVAKNDESPAKNLSGGQRRYWIAKKES